ncbi:CIPK25 [Symbiodinium natans]|uniref:CIPK25 protein n=1 Tax=Symbiodinium natans TaxID=878477 RepID=A0A812N2J7_9DINO|nr:CIPK25 [Symbiodinium natans]
MLYLLTYSSYPPFLTDATGRAQVAYRPLQDGNIPSKQTTLDILITQMLDPDPGHTRSGVLLGPLGCRFSAARIPKKRSSVGLFCLHAFPHCSQKFAGAP